MYCKKIMFVVMLLLFIILIHTKTYASDSFNLSIVPNIDKVNPGDEITYTVKIGAVHNLAGFKFKLVIPEGLSFVGGQEVSNIKTTLNAVKAEFTETTKVFVIGSSNYTSNSETVLMTFKCLANENAIGKQYISLIINEDDVFDTSIEMNNIIVNYYKDNSLVEVCEKEENPIYTTIDTITVNNVENEIMIFDTENTIANMLIVDNFPIIDKNYTIKVFDEEGTEKSVSEKIGSKNIIKIIDPEENVVYEYISILKGDINGDGELKLYDAFKILIGTIVDEDGNTLDEIDILIRDYNNDGLVKLFDAFKFLIQAIVNS